MPVNRVAETQAADILMSLFNAGHRSDTFGFIHTLLRVDGHKDAEWDPFGETVEAIADLRWHIDADAPDLSPKSPWRIGLLAYCHLCEASAVHITLANLLRLTRGQPYSMVPFAGQGRKPNQRTPWKWVPASAKTKWRTIAEQAREQGFAAVAELVETVYRDDIRNAFSHSDYVLTENDFRWTEGGPAAAMPLEDLEAYIQNAFAFSSAFLAVRRSWLEVMGGRAPYHRLPNYEVLELLRSEDRLLAGFRLHFSNGQTATYTRGPGGCICENVILGSDGTINFNCGPLHRLKPAWLVDGRQLAWDQHGQASAFRT